MSSQVESSQVESAPPRMATTATLMSNERTVPILHRMGHSAAPAPGDPMEVTSSVVPSPQPTIVPTMGPPPSRTSPDASANGANTSNEQGGEMGGQNQNGSMLAPSSAGGSGQQPKVQQTAFIHKLYNMLDDPSISHLITWSPSEESFLMSPSNDFSKVLAQYFKHTNISSFVRQLNMYGFHKVSDVFHTGSPEAQLWEFKHGNGSFRRGDLAGLRDIRRRASKQALVHRDSYPSAKQPSYSHPGTPAEPVQPPMDTDGRLANLEHAMYDAHHRLARTEEANQALHHKNHVLAEALNRSLQVTSELSRLLLNSAANQDSIYGRITDMQQEIQRQTELLQNIDEPLEPSFAGFRPYFSNLSLEGQTGAPTHISPHQLAQDDHRRQALGQRPGGFRPTVPSHLSITPRRYGSIGAQGGVNTSTSSPSSLRYQVAAGSSSSGAPPPPSQNPLGRLEPGGPNLARRHTSADIRIQPWQNNAPYPLPPGVEHQQPPSQWMPSPTRTGPSDPEGQRIRESFSSYSFKSASASQPQSAAQSSRPSTPPLGGSSNGASGAPEWNWGGNKDSQRFGGAATLGSSLGTFGANQHNTHALFKDSALNSGPPTRRGSMAHILNPEETREKDEENGEREEEDRKRKRLQ